MQTQAQFPALAFGFTVGRLGEWRTRVSERLQALLLAGRRWIPDLELETRWRANGTRIEGGGVLPRRIGQPIREISYNWPAILEGRPVGLDPTWRSTDVGSQSRPTGLDWID